MQVRRGQASLQQLCHAVLLPRIVTFCPLALIAWLIPSFRRPLLCMQRCHIIPMHVSALLHNCQPDCQQDE